MKYNRVKLSILAIVSLTFIGCGSSGGGHDTPPNITPQLTQSDKENINEVNAKQQNNEVNTKITLGQKVILNKPLTLTPPTEKVVAGSGSGPINMYNDQEKLDDLITRIDAGVKVNGKGSSAFNHGNITNNSDSLTAFAMFATHGGTVVNEATLTNTSIIAGNSAIASNEGTINIDNKYGAVGIYGILNSNIYNYKNINISGKNTSAMNVYSGSTANNLKNINVNGTNSTGMFSEDQSTSNNLGTITIKGEYGQGMSAENYSTFDKNGNIMTNKKKSILNNKGNIILEGNDQIAMGAYSNSTANNLKDININGNYSIGMCVFNNSTANNLKNITISGDYSKGMSAENYSTINNKGNIILNGHSQTAMSAINHSTINNTGNITLSGTHTLDDLDDHDNSAFYLDSTSKFENHGTISYKNIK